jgi:Ubiquitinol-cytochrome C reductase Fe-S subunit TAT signal
MMERRQIRQQIDSCRPTVDDLGLEELVPLAERMEVDRELRETFARAQRLDGRIARAMDDVPVPAGLSDRILDALAADGAVIGQCAPHVPFVSEPQTRRERDEYTTALADCAGQCHTRQTTRRRWLVSVAAGAAVVVAAVAVWHFRSQPSPLSVESLLASGGRWHAELSRSSSWHVLPPGQMINAYPPATAVRAVPHRWADVSALVGRPAVAYDLSDGREHQATLFVIPAAVPGAAATPPRSPGSNTGGRQIGVWQVGGLVYVLVVEGDVQRYQNLLDASGPPLA